MLSCDLIEDLNIAPETQLLDMELWILVVLVSDLNYIPVISVNQVNRLRSILIYL